MPNPYEPKTAFYTPLTFSKEAKLAEMYGSQASRRDKRKFEKYWNSEQRYNDEDAFNRAETDKMFASADARFNEISNAWKARNTAAQVAAAVTPQETPAPAPAPAPTPVLRPRRTNAEWDALAAEKTGGKYKTMAEVRALQQQMQNAGIDIGRFGADGKWGSDTQRAYDAYLASQNGAAGNTPTQTLSPAAAGNPSAQDALDARYYNDKAYTRTRLDDGTFGYKHNVTGTMYLMDGKVRDLTGAMGTVNGDQVTWENAPEVKQAPGQQRYNTIGQLEWDAKRMFNEKMGGKYNGAEGAVDAMGRQAFDYRINSDPEFLQYLKEFKAQYHDNGWGSGRRFVFTQPTDPHLAARKEAWLKENARPEARGPLGGGYTDEYEAWLQRYNQAQLAGFRKQGGTMNRIKYFQQGGAAPQLDMQQQVVALVQAAMQGDKKATQTVNQIMEAAKAGDQQATQIAQMIQQVVQQMQGQATAAKWGSKLNYIKSLKYAKGGKTCPACEQKVEMKKCGGKKAKKRYFGGYL